MRECFYSVGLVPPGKLSIFELQGSKGNSKDPREIPRIKGNSTGAAGGSLGGIGKPDGLYGRA